MKLNLQMAVLLLATPVLNTTAGVKSYTAGDLAWNNSAGVVSSVTNGTLKITAAKNSQVTAALPESVALLNSGEKISVSFDITVSGAPFADDGSSLRIGFTGSNHTYYAAFEPVGGTDQAIFGETDDPNLGRFDSQALGVTPCSATFRLDQNNAAGLTLTASGSLVAEAGNSITVEPDILPATVSAFTNIFIYCSGSLWLGNQTITLSNLTVETVQDDPPPPPDPEPTHTIYRLSVVLENATNLLVTYSRPASATETCTLETTDSLVSNVWKTAGMEMIGNPVTDTNGVSETVTFRLSATNNIGFVRLRIQETVVAVSPVELLLNGTFEGGDIGWSADGQHVIVTDVAHTGNASLQYVATDLFAGLQTLPVVGGREYAVSGWIKTDAGFSGSAAVVLDCRDIDANNLGFTTFGTTYSGTDWTNVTQTITVPTNAVLMKIVLKTYNSTGLCWFDDFSVLQTNGPVDTAIAAPANPPLAGTWIPTFEDNFNGTELDGSKWKLGSYSTFINSIAGISSDSFSVSNGALTIRAKLEPVTYGGIDYDFTAGEVTTMKRFRQKYGYFEARLRYRCVIGMFPAFWTMPDRGWYGNEDTNYKSLLKFDVSSFSTPVSSAQLHLKIDSVSSTNKELINIFPISDEWSENSVTWNNMPVENPLWLVHDATITNVAGDELIYDLTGYINEQIADDGTASLLLCDTFSRSVQFTFLSRESASAADRPRLVIDGATVEACEDASVRGGSYTSSNYGSSGLLTVKEAWQRDNCSTYITTNSSDVVEQGMEMDVFEDTGMSGTYEVHGGMHWDGYAWDHPHDNFFHTDTTFTVEEYHTYGMYWEEGLIEYYIDGNLMKSFETNRVCTAPSYIFLSLQMGGWGINANPAYYNDYDYPADMDVDYVKVWSGTKQ